MSDNFVRDPRPPRVNWDKLNQGPTAEDLEDIPATTAEDWRDADILAPLPPSIARRLMQRKGTRLRRSPTPRDGAKSGRG